MRLLPTLLLAILCASTALAGPWPRAHGESYVFAGHEGGTDGWTGLYAEHGLPRDLTLGLDVGGHGTHALATGLPADIDGRARVFLRLPVLSTPARRAARPAWAEPWLAALELGLGAELETDGDVRPRASVGLALGRPLDTRLGPGWTSLDLRATAGGGRPPRWNAGLVAGAKPTDRLTLEIGAFVEAEDGTYLTLAPTVQYRLGDRLGALRVGAAVKDDGTRLLRLGWARTF